MSANTEIQKKSPALGRGLDALFQNRPTPTSSIANPTTNVVGDKTISSLNLKMELIRPNPEQSRKIFSQDELEGLALSIKEHGIIQPIVVRKKIGFYEIIAGERRYRAAQILGLKEIPAIIRSENDSQSQQTDDLANLLENVQREDLKPLELAHAYQGVIEKYQFSQEEFAKKMGVSRVSISNTIRLLKLPQTVKSLLESGTLSEGHARALLALELEPKKLENLAARAVEKSWSVRETETEVRLLKAAPKSSQPISMNTGSKESLISPEARPFDAIESELREIFGTKVTVRKNGSKGAVEIFFSNTDSLHRVIHQLRGLKS
jgi:ParB family chromosome partitioning protein